MIGKNKIIILTKLEILKKKFDKISKPQSPVKNKILKKKNIINLDKYNLR